MHAIQSGVKHERIITAGKLIGIPIKAPLKHIPVHIKQAEAVGFLLPYEMRVGFARFGRIRRVPAILDQLGLLVTPTESRC
jgi:hypothetical protein